MPSRHLVSVFALTLVTLAAAPTPLHAQREHVGVATPTPSTGPSAPYRSATAGFAPVAVGVSPRPVPRDRWRGARRGALVGGAIGAVLIGLGIAADVTVDGAMVPVTLFAVPAAAAVTLIGAGVGALAAPPARPAAPDVRVGVRTGGAWTVGLAGRF